MKGDTRTNRLGRLRWEATYEVAPFAWVVATARTRRGARRALRNKLTPSQAPRSPRVEPRHRVGAPPAPTRENERSGE